MNRSVYTMKPESAVWTQRSMLSYFSDLISFNRLHSLLSFQNLPIDMSMQSGITQDRRIYSSEVFCNSLSWIILPSRIFSVSISEINVKRVAFYLSLIYSNEPIDYQSWVCSDWCLWKMCAIRKSACLQWVNIWIVYSEIGLTSTC